MAVSELLSKIENLCLDNVLSQRVNSFEIIPMEKGTDIYACQCNMAEMRNIDIKLPTALHLVLDENACVIKAELLENFKGSQGMPCSLRYLNRILKEKIIGVSFLCGNEIIKDEFIFHCRHIYELVSGAMMLFQHSKANQVESVYAYDTTKAIVVQDGIMATDVFQCYGKQLKTEVHFIFEKSDIGMQENGKVARVKHLRIDADIYEENEKILTMKEEIKNAYNYDVVVLHFMKIFSKLWKGVGKYFNIRSGFYYTNLFPPTFYGIFVQLLALVLFPNNYNYFQHSISGLQRMDGKPLCIGIINNMEEGKRFFNTFCEEDLYD